jgi:WD40 repeat protein
MSAGPDPADEAARRDLRAVLDEELSRLPERPRAAALLCDFQGKPHQQAARELGWPAGSLSRHLARARELLRERLTRRGVTVPATLAAVAATPAVPADLSAEAVRVAGLFAAGLAAEPPAVALAEGALRAMRPAKLRRTLVALTALAGLAAGAGLLARPTPTDPPPAPPAAEGPAVAADRFGDPLPEGAVARLGTQRFRHEWWVGAGALSPDGKTIATLSSLTVSLWDAATGRELRRLHTGGQFQFALAFSPDGRTLATADIGMSVQLWDTATGQEARRFKVEFTPGERSYSNANLAFTPDGRSLVVQQASDPTIRLVDARTGLTVRHFTGADEVVTALAVAPDGKTLAASGSKGGVWLWDLGTGQGPRTLPRLTADNVLAFTPDGRTLATGGNTGRIRLWDVGALTERKSWDGHTGSVCTVAFADDGRTLVSAGTDRTIRRWDAATSRELSKLEHEAIGPILLTPDGMTAVCPGGHGHAEHAIRLFDLAAGKPVRYFEGHEGNLRAVAYSPDGRLLATGAERGAGPLRLWDTATGRELRQLTRDWPGANVTALAFSPDGHTLAAGEMGGAVTLWDVAAGKPRRDIPAHRHNVLALAFSPDGREVVSGSYDGTVRVSEAATGKELRTFRVEKEIAWGLALSADGRVAASGDQEQTTVHLWDVATGKELRQVNRGTSGSVNVALSPDGKTLAVGSGGPGLLLVEVASGQERRRLPLKSHVNHLAFSPDGRFLAAGTQNNDQTAHTVHRWVLTADRELPPRTGHRAWVSALAFAPDGRALASGSYDTTALIWSMADASAAPPADLALAWSDLASDARRAYSGIGALIAAGDRGVSVIAKELHPAAPPADVTRLVADLNSDRFPDRDRAMKELEALGPAAEPGLRAALPKAASAEVRARVLRLTQAAEARRLQGLRALEVLERVGTPDARRELADLAGGAVDDGLTREARACLWRLKRVD